MTPSRITSCLLTGLLLLAWGSPALAQWKWRDAEGRVQYSDRPPPPGVAEKDILQRPAGQALRVVTLTPGAPASAAASAPAAPGRAASEPSSRQRLEDEKRREDEKRQGEIRAENCRRANNQMRLLESGVRVTRDTAGGEREFLDDKGRQEEMRRARAVIASECKSDSKP
jgi:hypothetical protein